MIERKFSKSFDECLQQAYRFHTGFLTDKTTFTSISTKFADPFAADFFDDIEEADAIPTYEDDLGQQMLLTGQIEEKMTEARQHYQKLMFNVNVAWPGDESIARVFGNALYDNARKIALKMINLLQNAHNNANSLAYKAGLIAAGFVQLDIDLLDTLADELTACNNAQDDYIMKTYERTETKNKAFNKVWDSMVLISDASKLIFRDSPAKIEFYLLYPEGGPTGLPGKIQNLAYNEIITKFTWDADAVAATYQLEVTTDGVSWDVMYEGSDAFCQVGQDPGTYYARVRGINDKGNGAWSDVLEYTVIIQAPNLTEVVYQPANNRVVVDWQATSYADKYEVWKSEVASGQPAGTFSMISEPVNHLYYDTSYTPGDRCYYYVKAVSVAFGMTSAASTTMYAEITV